MRVLSVVVVSNGHTLTNRRGRRLTLISDKIPIITAHLGIVQARNDGRVLGPLVEEHGMLAPPHIDLGMVLVLAVPFEPVARVDGLGDGVPAKPALISLVA